MMSNQAENQSHHEKEVEYTGVVNLSGKYNLDLLNQNSIMQGTLSLTYVNTFTIISYALISA